MCTFKAAMGSWIRATSSAPVVVLNQIFLISSNDVYLPYSVQLAKRVPPFIFLATLHLPIRHNSGLHREGHWKEQLDALFEMTGNPAHHPLSSTPYSVRPSCVLIFQFLRELSKRMSALVPSKSSWIGSEVGDIFSKPLPARQFYFLLSVPTYRYISLLVLVISIEFSL